MKHIKKKFLLDNFKKYLPIIFITALAIFLRFYFLERRVFFDADQEEIAFKAKELLTGNPVLLGPKTSLGGFSIGPGFTYLWAIFSFFLRGNPISGAYLSIFLGILTLLAVYLIGKKIFSENIALILAFIMSVSIGFIAWDQQAWAPSLFYLAELVAFYGAYISGKNKYGLPVIAAGLAAGFQSHFGVFLLIPAIIVYLLICRPVIQRKYLAVSLLILALSAAPVLLYDFSHGFVNIQRFVSIFSLGQSGVAPPRTKILATLVSNSVSTLWTSFPSLLKCLVFAVVSGFSAWGIYKDSKYRALLLLSGLLLLVPPFIFLFYKSSFSEYYLMTATIPFLLLLGYIFSAINKKYLIFLILGVSAFLNLRSFIAYGKPMNLYAKEQIVQEIVGRGGDGGYGVSLNVQPGYGFGYSYLFDYYKAAPDIPPLEGEQKIFTIISPPKYGGVESMFEVDGIGLRWEGI
jgi:4-amino-4-deoxy-L-arabinose transferase-like glycosyltransferase